MAAMEPIRIELDSTVRAEGATLRGVGATTGTQLEKAADVPGHGRVTHMMFQTGCFDRSLAADGFDMDLILSHDTRQRAWASISEGTLNVELDGKRLVWEATLPPSRNRDNLLLALEQGDIGGCSVGGKVSPPFDVTNRVLMVRDYDINGGEVSLVSEPANAQTWVEVALAADDTTDLDNVLRLILDKRPGLVLEAVKAMSGDGTAPVDGGKISEEDERILWAWRQRHIHDL